MTVRVYRSTDAGAPELSGTAGTLIGVLDACLVDGYGSLAAAGWTKAFSGVNKAAYKQPATSNQFYLRVDDTGTTSARVVGYESMTDVDTGVAAFPTEAQVAGGLYCTKSSVASGLARAWIMVATDSMFYLYINQDGAVASTAAIMMAFGDITSYKADDAYQTLIIAGTAVAGSGNQFAKLSTTITEVESAHYLARDYTQFGSAKNVGKHSDLVKSKAADDMGRLGLTYPNPPDGGLYMAPVWIHEPSILRGLLPGIWNPLHTQPITHLDTFSGAGDLAGKTFLALNLIGTAQVFVETSDTW